MRHKLAFERVIVEVRETVDDPGVIFTICFNLCSYALDEKEKNSLEIGLYHFLPWCRDNGLLDECTSLENGLFNMRN